MRKPRIHPDSRDWLIRTLVHLAHIDGRVVPVEGALVERFMTTHGSSEDEKARIRKQLRKIEPFDVPGRPPSTLSYEEKVDCFREIVELVFADGVLHRNEEAEVMKLANVLGLHPGDMQPVWDRAKRHWDGTREH